MKTRDEKVKIFIAGLYGMSAFFVNEKFPHIGETVKGNEFFFEVGGKGFNQALCAKKLDADVTFFTALGGDYFTKELKDILEMHKFGFFQFEDTTNDFACIISDKSSQNFVVLNNGASSKLTSDHFDEISDLIISNNGVLLQNEIPLDATIKILEIAHASNLITVFDPAPVTQELINNTDILKLCDVVKPNWGEAVMLTNSNENDSPYVVATKLKKLGAKNVVITLGDEGCFMLSEDNSIFEFPRFTVDAIDSTGAGDVFSAALCVALCEGEALEEAIQFASGASALSVTKRGVISGLPTRIEVDDFITKQKEV